MNVSSSGYRSAHTEFVSGHTGTTLNENSLITSTVSIGVLLRCIIERKSPAQLGALIACILDFLILVLPGQLVVTLWSDYVTLFVILTLAASLTFVLTVCNSPRFSWSKFREKECSPKLSFISNYRAYTLIYTAISILAVDFAIYPRRLCKAETYGTGLMDTGVGLFVIANAIVSLEARLGEDKNLSLKKTLKSSFVLICLGLGRLFTTKAVDYHEHATEYGVHWNFFFTLAMIKIAGNLLSLTISNIPWGGLSLVMGLCHQLVLSHGGSQYIIQGLDGKGGRQGLIDANREGIISSLGYISLYFFGIEFGQFLFSKKRNRISDLTELTTPLAMLQCVLWGALLFTSTHVEPVSRRFANLSYILWILAMSTMLLLQLLLVDIFTEAMYFDGREETGSTSESRRSVPLLLDAVNFNGLAYFLLSNILTGLVNLCVSTIYQTAFVSFFAITVYMILLQCIIVALYSSKTAIKL